MLSSDSGSDDEQFTFVPHESIKDVLTIIHKGKPPKEPQPFAMGSNKKVYWPADLWNSGTLIYSIENPKVNLKPPIARTDRILRFNSRFESGNLSLAYQLAPDTYHLILEYDKNKSGSCQWFYFQMTNVRKDIKYSFYISGFHKSTTVDHGGLKVFWYSEKRANEKGISWSRGGYNYEYGVTLRDASRKRASLQFKISFPYDKDTVYLCYALPYTYSDLQRNILNWKKNHISIFSSTTLCQTLGGRDCPLLTITSPKNIAENNKNHLFFTARVHPGESNGSYVIHGLIDFLLSDHPAAKYLVDKYIIKIVPMLNIDGVVEGFYRIGLSGVDLNRVWTSPNPTLHPVITATKNLIKNISKTGNIAVYIDFHGHSRLNGSFAYGCPNNVQPTSKEDVFLNCDKSLINTEKLLPRIISFLSDAFSWGSCQFSYPKERKAASRIVIRKELGIVQSFTIESSFGGIISGPRAGVLYDELIWKELGSKCGEGVYHMVTKKTSPLASYVEKEISLITPNCCLGINSNDNDDNNDLILDNSNDQNDELEETNEKNHTDIHQTHNNELEMHASTKSTKKHKKKGTLKKKKSNNSESKPPKLNNINFNININSSINTIPIDEFSKLLNQIVNNNAIFNNNTINLNDTNNTDINKDNTLNTNNSDQKETNTNISKDKARSDEISVPDTPIKNIIPDTQPVTTKKENDQPKKQIIPDRQSVTTKKENDQPKKQIIPDTQSVTTKKENDQPKKQTASSSLSTTPSDAKHHLKIHKKSTTKKESVSTSTQHTHKENNPHQHKDDIKPKSTDNKEDASPSTNQDQINNKESENSNSDDVVKNVSHNHDDIEIDYLNQRRIGKFGPTTLFRMSKPRNNLFANSKNISSQSPGYSVPKWVNIQFSKR